MKKANLNDFITDIIQDFVEIESMTKVLKDSVSNEYTEITREDIANTLEILIAKLSNTRKSLAKFIENCFEN